MATKGVKVENIRILIVSIHKYTKKHFCNKKISQYFADFMPWKKKTKN
jgi:hypothetical protein